MEDNFDSYQDDEEFLASLNRFEKMLNKDSTYFFDVEDFEDLIDYYLDYNIIEKAKKAIDISLLQHPTSSALKLKKASYLINIYQLSKSLDILNEIEHFEPFNIDLFVLKAGVYSQLKKHNKAIEYYTKALNFTDDEDELINFSINIALEYENTDEYDKSLQVLKKLINKYPDNETVLYEISFCYGLKNNLEAGVRFFTQFIDDHPYNHHAWFNLAVQYGRLELTEKAIDAYDYAIAIKDDFLFAYFNKASLLNELGAYKEAIECYQETFKYEDSDAATHTFIGNCYEKLEDFKLAQYHYSKATKLDEYYTDAWAGLAVIAEEDNKFHAALYYIEKAIEQIDYHSEYWYIYGDILSKSGMFDEALKAYMTVFKLDESNEDVWLDIAEMVRDYEGLKNALIYLEKGIEAQSDNYYLLARLVAYLLMLGKEQEAGKKLVTLLTFNIDYLDEIVIFYPEILNHPRILDIIENFNNENEF